MNGMVCENFNLFVNVNEADDRPRTMLSLSAGVYPYCQRTQSGWLFMISPLNDELPTTICDHFQCLYGVTESYDSTNQGFWGYDNAMNTYSMRRDISEGEC